MLCYIQKNISDFFFFLNRHFEVPVKNDDPDFTTVIKINRTRPDNCTRLPGVTTKICKNFPRDFEFCKDAKDYETHQNINTHWWDASQLYGVDATLNNRIRSKMNGKLKLTADNRLPIDSYNGLPVTGKLSYVPLCRYMLAVALCVSL